MRRAVLAVATFVVACVLAVSAGQPPETVTVSPAFGIAGHYGTWTVTYTVGPGGIAPGGALQGDVDLPRTVEFPAGQGWTTVPFTPRSEGVVRLEAVARADLLRTRSNPREVFSERPAEQIWWGDLHSHTEHNFDGVGSGVFDYARWVSGLDFHAMTDHSNGPAREGFTRGLGPHVWVNPR